MPVASEIMRVNKVETAILSVSTPGAWVRRRTRGEAVGTAGSKITVPPSWITTRAAGGYSARRPLAKIR